MLLIALLSLTASAAVSGPESIGRLFLKAGLPSFALPLLNDDAWRGIALYRLERFEEAAEAFRLAGPSSGYDRGTALAKARKFELAVQTFEAVLARDPGDVDAKANHDLILPFTGAATEDGSGPNSIARQLGERAKTNNRSDTMTIEEAFEKVRERSKEVSRPLERKEVTANRQWLATLPDEPGRYLKLRIAAEYARRKASGEAPPPGDDPW
jgi:Ca-activated chloride channel family protein